MQNNLKSLIEQVASAVSQVNHSAGEVNMISSQSAEGMQHQQKETSQVSSAMTEMESVIHDISKNTETSAQETQDAMNLTKNGNDQVKLMIDAMMEVADSIRLSSETVAELEKRSQQIHIFVDVIQDIAEQTNLLALNAAIEAARAGESTVALLLLLQRYAHLLDVHKIQLVKSALSSKNLKPALRK